METIYYDDPRTMQMVVRRGDEQVAMSYEMFDALRKMLQAQVIEVVERNIYEQTGIPIKLN
ncbi:hypothetical protein ACLPBM_22705 [Escherichia coli]|uniref:hypothetical protein n=1 Tax=Enterobacterales TaxID=91347 RepID=UPI00389180E0